jgi:D-beta-D-heptose 7-phosphate kinase/D-beta-D-heptose 1-phosphate adenosyltransferase
MKHFNASVYLLAFLDSFSYDKFSESSFNCKYSVLLNEGHIPIKKRFYDEDFPLPRWDVESSNYGCDSLPLLRKQIFCNLQALLDTEDIDIIILSDYGKGVFDGGLSEEIIKECNKRHMVTIVDPKDRNLAKWRDCAVFKPNIDYVNEIYKKYDIESFSSLQSRINCNGLIVTASGEGVAVYHNGKENWVQSSKRPHVKSVIGAGDCFCAILSLSMSHGMSIRDAAEIAFDAGSVYVEAKHNAPITPYQLARWDDPIKCKVVSAEDLAAIKETFPQRAWVWTNGCFDLLHSGHLSTFSFAKSLGDKLIVGLNTDESVKKLKGSNRPINSYLDRANQLAHLLLVDFIVPIEESPHSVIQLLQPDKIVKGADYKIEDICGVDIVGAENVHQVPLVKGLSTTNLIQKASNG